MRSPVDVSRDGGRDGARTTARTAALVAELICIALSPPLLLWAGSIWANIFGYDDSGALNYTVIAPVVAGPSLLLLAVAVGLRTRGRVDGPSSRRRPWPVGRIATVTAHEWLVGVCVLGLATPLWLLGLAWGPLL